MNWVVGFGRFWYDFIVGDSVILAIGGVVVLVLGFVLTRLGTEAVGQVALPAVVIATLGVSLKN
jgi:hypothetical protein